MEERVAVCICCRPMRDLPQYQLTETEWGHRAF